MDRRQNLKVVASATSMTTGVSAGPPGAIRKQIASVHGQSGKDDDLRHVRTLPAVPPTEQSRSYARPSLARSAAGAVRRRPGCPAPGMRWI